MRSLPRIVALALAAAACKRHRAPADTARVTRPPAVGASITPQRSAPLPPIGDCAPWTACSLPAIARTPPRELDARERVEAPGFSLRAVHRFAHHGRGRVACHYDPPRRAVACVTDALSDDWHVKGVRLVRVDPATFAVEERLVAPSLHASFLWGDFNRDGAPDFWGFSDELKDADARAVLHLGTPDPWTFRPTRPLSIDHPALGGAVLDADGDGCEDVLVLGTGWEFQRDRPVQYFADGLYRGDCRGGFALANASTGLDRLPDFVGNDAPPRLGRAAAVTDLDGDRCADLVIGNYRAHADRRHVRPASSVTYASPPRTMAAPRRSLAKRHCTAGPGGAVAMRSKGPEPSVVQTRPPWSTTAARPSPQRSGANVVSSPVRIAGKSPARSSGPRKVALRAAVPSRAANTQPRVTLTAARIGAAKVSRASVTSASRTLALTPPRTTSHEPSGSSRIAHVVVGDHVDAARGGDRPRSMATGSSSSGARHRTAAREHEQGERPREPTPSAHDRAPSFTSGRRAAPSFSTVRSTAALRARLRAALALRRCAVARVRARSRRSPRRT